MEFDEPRFEPGKTSEYINQVGDLTDDQRREYEAVCERLEDLVERPDVSLSVLLSEVRSEPPVRNLVLIHLGKLWLESERKSGRSPDLSAFLDSVPQLQRLDSARSQLAAWVSGMAETVSQPTSDSLDFRGHKFHLPDEYELIDRLQDNPSGMSLVLLVRNRRLGRKEVLKAINPVRRGEARAVRRFLDEPMRASQTMHQAIIRVWHASKANCACPYYTMEYLEGGSLADLLKAGHVAPAQSVRYIAIVARALHHIHTTLDIAHGDIKPDNILLDKEGNPKLTDFGLSRPIVADDGQSFAQSGLSNEVAGTIGFVAPEQVDERFRPAGYDKNQLRIATDLFALGATLYYCLSRHLPYQQGTQRPTWFAAITNELVPVQQLNPEVDDKLDAIAQKCLQKSPDRRFATAAEFADALEAWLSHETLQQILPTEDKTFPNRTPRDHAPEDTTFPPTGSRKLLIGAGGKPRSPFYVAASVLILTAAFALWKYATGGDAVPVETITKKDSPKPPPDEPKDPPSDNPYDRLRRTGWDGEAAKSVLELNEPWLSVVRAVNPSHADHQIDLLSRLGNSGVPLDFCRTFPHRAAMLTTLSARDEHRALASVLSTSDADLADRLFSLYPSAGEAQALVHLFKEEAELLRELDERGWLGCETALLRSGETEADRVYNAWLQWIIKERLVPAQSDSARKRAAEFQTYAMLQGPSLKVRLTNNPEFRDRFLSELWPAFVSLLDNKIFSLPDVFQVDALWTYLMREGEKGKRLLEDYKLAPVALLYGPNAKDFEGLHDRVVRLLESGNKSVVDSLFELRFRGQPAFRKLVEKDIRVEVLSVALEQARKDPTILNDYANRSVEYLTGELEPLWNENAEKSVEGRLVYLTVPLKLLTGQELYSREKTALFRQAVADVASGVMLYFGVGVDFQNGFDMGYWSVLAGVDSIEKANQRKFLEDSRRRYEQGEMPTFETANFLEKPTDFVQLFEQTHRIMGLARRPEGMNLSQGFDVAMIVRMYKSLLDSGNPRRNAADRTDVHMMLLNKEQFAIVIHDEPNTVPIRRFFNHRSEILSSVSNASFEQRETAWRQSISAWWLLHASQQLDLLDPPQ
jgi:serine/threonine protein kinase